MTTELWGAVSDLADKWRGSKTVHAVVSVMPRDGRQSRAPITVMLSELRGMSVRAHALRLWSELGYMLPQPPWSHVSRPREFDAWLPAVGMVEAAFREQLAWVRAQLPGYPLLRTPQMVQNTPFTTEEFTWRAAWRKADLARGFQLQPPPVVTFADEKIDMSGELKSVVAALRAGEDWRHLANARSAMTPTDWDELSVACKALRAALSPARVDEYEPNLASRRDDYRRTQMEDALSGLRGNAAAYAQAFEAASDAVDFAFDEVLPQLVTYGRPKDIGPVTDLDIISSDEISLSPRDLVLWTGKLLFVSDPLIAEVGQVTRIQFFEDHGIASQVVGLRLIAGAATGWGLR